MFRTERLIEYARIHPIVSPYFPFAAIRVHRIAVECQQRLSYRIRVEHFAASRADAIPLGTVIIQLRIFREFAPEPRLADIIAPEIRWNHLVLPIIVCYYRVDRPLVGTFDDSHRNEQAIRRRRSQNAYGTGRLGTVYYRHALDDQFSRCGTVIFMHESGNAVVICPEIAGILFCRLPDFKIYDVRLPSDSEEPAGIRGKKDHRHTSYAVRTASAR